MNNQKSVMLTPALIGGVIAGALSGIPILNCLCCLWIIGGAMLAAYLMVKDSPTVFTSGDGAIVGVFTGIIAVLVRSVLDIVLRPFYQEFAQRMWERAAEWTEEMPPGFEELLEGGAFESTVPRFLFGLLVYAIIFAGLGALGGILGISLFGKKTPPATEGGTDVSPENKSDCQP